MPEALLGELLGSRGITYGVVKPGDNTPGGVPLLKAADVENGRVNINPAFRISPDKHQEHCRTELTGGELLITLVGTPGQCAIAPIEVKGFNVVRAVGVFTVKEDISSRYVMYAIQSPSSQNHILNICNTTVQATLNLGDLKGLPLRIPPLQEQKAIANILGTLDDKIELNRKTNETLEAMAKALFKSWFVDFDPVRAKAEGRSTGLPAEISDLFPDSFEDSELGEIPSAWRVNTFEQICESIYSGGTPLTTEPNYWNGGLPWFSSGETRNTFVNTTDKTISLLGVEESSTRFAKKFSTVIASAGQGHTRGQTSMLLLDSYVNQSVVVLEASKEMASEHFVFFDASRRYDEFRRVSDSSSSRGSLTTKILASLTTVNPPRQIHGIFKSIVGAHIERIHSNLDQILVLTDARDCLLPKLISGEIRIPDAEKMLEEVGI